MFLKKHLESLGSDMKITFGNFNTLKAQKIFSNTKSPVPLMKKSGLIYSVPCLDCLEVYVGEMCQ